MLAFAIAAFFSLSLVGALFIIGMMFYGYKERIKQIILDGLNRNSAGPVVTPNPYRHRMIRPRQMVQQHRTLQPAQLRAAA